MDEQVERSGQEVWAERFGQRPQQENPGALLLTQLLQELGLLRDPAAQGLRRVPVPLLPENQGKTGRCYIQMFFYLYS